MEKKEGRFRRTAPSRQYTSSADIVGNKSKFNEEYISLGKGENCGKHTGSSESGGEIDWGEKKG